MGRSTRERCADCGVMLKKEKNSDSESRKDGKSAASAAGTSVRPRMTKETLDEFQEFQELRRWKQSGVQSPKRLIMII